MNEIIVQVHITGNMKIIISKVRKININCGWNPQNTYQNDKLYIITKLMRLP